MKLAFAFVVLAALAAPAYADDDHVAFAFQVWLPLGVVVLAFGLLGYIIYRVVRRPQRSNKDEEQ